MKNHIKRINDLITKKKDIENLITFKNFPVFMGCVPLDTNKKNDLTHDMKWGISRDSGLIQLMELIPLDILYQSQHAGAVGGIWKRHHEELSKIVQHQKFSSVFEIGAGHGELSRITILKQNIKWRVLEPNPRFFSKTSIEVEEGFFDSSYRKKITEDCVIHSHVFEHVYDPMQFIKDIANKVTIGTKMIFSVPNIEEMIKNGYTNALDFEHTYFLNEPVVEFFLKTNGFEIIEKQYFLKDHSIFYVSEKSKEPGPINFNKETIESTKSLFISFVKKLENISKDVNLAISNHPNEHIYVFGAHGFAQYLFNFGVKQDKVISILDNDILKQGNRLYGTDLKVESPKLLKNMKNPLVVCHAGQYTDEIKSDITNNINAGVKFV